MATDLITQQQVKSLKLDDFTDIFGDKISSIFKTTPKLHQYAATLWGFERNRTMVLFGIGTGKTYTALLLSKLWECKKILVVCPNSVRNTWKEEIELHTRMSYTELVGEAAERKRLLRETKSDIYIINYEGLKVIFGEKTLVKRRKTGVEQKVTQPSISSIVEAAFDCLIVDECFPAPEKVLTEIGWITIGELVEKQINVRVASYNKETRQVEFRKILRYIKKPLQGDLVKIKHKRGEICCTPNHKIYSQGKPIRADKLSTLNRLDILQVMLYNKVKDNRYENPTHLRVLQTTLSWLRRTTILFKKMCQSVHKQRSSNERSSTQREMASSNEITSREEKTRSRISKAKTACRIKKTLLNICREKLRALWKTVYHDRKVSTTLLLSDLCEQTPISSSWLCSPSYEFGTKDKNFSTQERKRQITSRICTTLFRENEEKQPFENAWRSREDISYKKKKWNPWVYLSRRSPQEDKRTRGGSTNSQFTYGISNLHKVCNRIVTFITSLLFGRYSRSSLKSSHRNRWWNPRFKTSEVYRQKKRNCLGGSRVESVEILKQRCSTGFGRGSEGNQTVYNLEVEENHNYFVNSILVSNCHHVREMSSLQSRICYHISRKAKRCIEMSGTPTSRDVADFWSLFMVLDQGKTLGNSITKFRFEYFNSYKIPLRSGIELQQWALKKGAKQKILDLVAPSTIRYDISECCDLPPVIREKRIVTMSEEQKDLYDRLLSDLKLDLNNGELTLNNVINKSSKLRQILSGFLMKGEKIVYLHSSPKLDELSDLFDEIEGKVIIYHHYVAEGRMIEQRLRKLKIPYAAMRGEIKDKDHNYKLFRDNEKVRVLVMHPQSGGEGLNLQMANVAVFFSQIGGGSIPRPQAEGRLVRQGQNQACVIIDILAVHPNGDETIDEKMFQVSLDDRQFSQNILDWLAKK